MDSEVVTGLADLQAQLEKLPVNIEKKLLRGALRAGQKVVLQRALSNIHSVSGDLADSLRISTSLRGSTARAIVKAGNAKAFYAHMVEFGTDAHIIEPKNGKAIALGGRDYSKLEHPGAKMHPFMRPALDAAATDNSEAFQAVGKYLQGRITKEIDKLPDEVDVKGAKS